MTSLEAGSGTDAPAFKVKFKSSIKKKSAPAIRSWS